MPPPSSASHLPSEILEMLGRVQDQAMIFSFTVDENNENAHFPYASPGAQAVYGVSAEEVMSDAMELVGRIHDDDLAGYVSSVEESWKQLSEWNFVFRSRFPGYPNNYKWLKASSMPKRLPNGHTIWYGAVYDVDAETRLGDSEKRQDSISNKYAHAFDLLNDVVFAVRATSWEAADWRAKHTHLHTAPAHTPAHTHTPMPAHTHLHTPTPAHTLHTSPSSIIVRHAPLPRRPAGACTSPPSRSASTSSSAA